MRHRTLGSTEIRVSTIAFGAGPVPAVMTGADRRGQEALVRRAVEAGVNWFDTAATYGNGKSEEGLGAALAAIGATNAVHLATKVRLTHEALENVEAFVRQSVQASLQRLRVESVTLLQLHNSITKNRGDEPTSLDVADVLGGRGVLAAFRRLQEEGVVKHLGITAIGDPSSMKQVLDSRAFATIQVPFSLVNPSAAHEVGDSFREADYGGIAEYAAQLGLGVFAIRVYAGGALLDAPPSAHTYKTSFFPLDLYQRDRLRAKRIAERLGNVMSVKEAALRYVLSQPAITSAIVGFARPEHIDEAARFCQSGPLPQAILDWLSHEREAAGLNPAARMETYPEVDQG